MVYGVPFRLEAEWLYQHIRTDDTGDCSPHTRAELVRCMESKWFLKGLPLDHAKTLHRKIKAMGKELDARVEIGMADKLKRNMREPIWPYFAIAQFDGDQLRQGFVIIPCASSYWLPWKLSTPAGVVHLPAWDGWTRLCPVKQEIEGSKGQVLQVTLDQLADRDTVRKGDAYLLNLTACPRLHYRHESLGTAVTFGQIDEVIDTVRCRLAFGMLPSA
jgi:hypothetical protein